MKKRNYLLVSILFLFVFNIFIYGQDQPLIEIGDTSNNTVTNEGNDIDDLEISLSGRLTKVVRVVGKVISVHDGDTIQVLDDNKQVYKVRFNGIDAPELKQDFGNRSKQSLSDLVFGKVVTIEYDKIDKYGRFVCKIFVDGIDVNLEQVKRGMAWHYKKYQDEQTSEDRILYAQAEDFARQEKQGMWGQNPTAPWDWRRGVNNPNLEGVPQGAIIGNKNSQIYHTVGCSSYAKVSPQNRVLFLNEQEAVKNGLKIANGCPTSLSFEERPKSNAQTPRVYQKGPRGGCFYLNASGKKVYADKSKCQ